MGQNNRSSSSTHRQTIFDNFKQYTLFKYTRIFVNFILRLLNWSKRVGTYVFPVTNGLK